MADSQTPKTNEPLSRADRALGVLCLFYLIVAITAAVGLLVYTWPLAAKDGSWLGVSIAKDQALLILVAVGGAIGSIVYCLRSATWYLGNREFRRSWAPWYIAQPFIGAALGMMVYVVVRAGFIQPSSNDAVNLFGFLAIAAIVGLYTEQALSQLKLVAETVLRPAPKGENATKHERLDEKKPPTDKEPLDKPPEDK